MAAVVAEGGQVDGLVPGEEVELESVHDCDERSVVLLRSICTVSKSGR